MYIYYNCTITDYVPVPSTQYLSGVHGDLSISAETSENTVCTMGIVGLIKTFLLISGKIMHKF